MLDHWDEIVEKFFEQTKQNVKSRINNKHSFETELAKANVGKTQRRLDKINKIVTEEKQEAIDKLNQRQKRWSLVKCDDKVIEEINKRGF